MGADKARLLLPNGHTTLAAVLDAARAVCARVTVSIDTAERARTLLAEIVPPYPAILLDERPGDGPLAALAAALHRLEADGLLVLSVDAPLMQPALLALLIARFQPANVALVQPFVGSRPQPMPAVYADTLANCARALLDQGRRDIGALSRCAQPHAVVLSEAELRHADPNLRSLQSANTPEEWRALLALAKS